MDFLGWVDYDDTYEKLARDAVAAIKGRDARDELGLGGVRDTLSDLFFPGTSTIQRRLRYFLFVPWCCEAAIRDARGRPLLSELRVKEERLIEALAHLGSGAGVIGRSKGAELVNMPSAIYWSGLRALDILKVPGSTRRWGRFVVERRREIADAVPDEDGGVRPPVPGFAHDLPPMPDGFPETLEALDFDLMPHEARYLRRRLCDATLGREGWGLEHNLFAAFGTAKIQSSARYLWDHPRAGSLPMATRHLLNVAKAFSSVMYGATLLYNYLLCSHRYREGDEEAGTWVDFHRQRILRWTLGVREADLELVRSGIYEIADIAPKLRHSVNSKTRKFVMEWVDVARDRSSIINSRKAHDLIENREKDLKCHLGTSRFANSAARERWNYASGGRLNYRWTIASSYLNDLAVAG